VLAQCALCPARNADSGTAVNTARAIGRSQIAAYGA
jgi:hypothetical protein